MFYYSSVAVGDYFLFLLAAGATSPVKVLFRERESGISKRMSEEPWREKIYLYPAILQRKWMDYSYKDRFFPSVRYDNVLPCTLSCQFFNAAGEETEIKLGTVDKQYRKIALGIIDSEGRTVFQKKIDRLTIRQAIPVRVSIDKPGVYTVILEEGEQRFRKSAIIFYRKNTLFGLQADNHIEELFFIGKKPPQIFCTSCRCEVFPVEPHVMQSYIYKNYIPFKEYVDFGKLGMENISNAVKKIPYPPKYRSGLIHLLNIIRLASIEDELSIVTSLFKDDPAFAYFVTEKLFMFNMIPLMDDRDLQRILNKVDDAVIARSIAGEERELASKVLRNISERRRKIVLDMGVGRKEREDNMRAKDELHGVIRSYFEIRVGRVLRIPVDDRLTFVRKKGDMDEKLLHSENFFCHSGTMVAVAENGLFQFQTGQAQDSCRAFDIEYLKDSIFSVVGVSESTLYLKSEMGIRYALIHQYSWLANIEDCEFLENLPRSSVTPLRYLSSGTILTIGGVSSKGVPLEQTIRLKVS